MLLITLASVGFCQEVIPKYYNEGIGSFEELFTVSHPPIVADKYKLPGGRLPSQPTIQVVKPSISSTAITEDALGESSERNPNFRIKVRPARGNMDHFGWWDWEPKSIREKIASDTLIAMLIGEPNKQAIYNPIGATSDSIWVENGTMHFVLNVPDLAQAKVFWQRGSVPEEANPRLYWITPNGGFELEVGLSSVDLVSSLSPILHIEVFLGEESLRLNLIPMVINGKLYIAQEFLGDNYDLAIYKFED